METLYDRIMRQGELRLIRSPIRTKEQVGGDLANNIIVIFSRHVTTAQVYNKRWWSPEEETSHDVPI